MKAKRKAEKPAPASEVRIGAPAALSRLEREERILFNAYEKAKKGGDVLATKLTRDAWLKCGEALRKYDVMLAAARRELGEVVLRSDVEAWLANLASWLHFGLLAATGTSDKAFQTMALSVKGFIGGDPKRHNHAAPVPLWMQRALFAQGVWSNPDEVALTWRRGFHAQEAAKLYPNDPAKFREHVESSMKADMADLKEQPL